MGFTLRGHTTGCVTVNTPSTVATLPVTTVAGDCIVVCFAIAGADVGGISVSGGGATWLGPLQNAAFSMAFIGYNCVGGSTSITIGASQGSGDIGQASIGIFSGVLASSNPVRSSLNTGTATSGSVSYVVGDLLIGNGGGFGTTSSSPNPSWSNGATDNLIDRWTAAGSERWNWTSYCVPSSGSSTTYTSGDTVLNNTTVVVLEPVQPPVPPRFNVGVYLQAVQRASVR
ncbi:MAG: hypothetical protein KGH65_04975 [Candidatus Micrarchaeota archaeon]|nr:hypothetical protein [Candidatus Micrarchaeota archaeon]